MFYYQDGKNYYALKEAKQTLPKGWQEITESEFVEHKHSIFKRNDKNKKGE